MTRKDFEAIAAIINAVQIDTLEQPASWTAYDIAEGIAKHMSMTNPRFDRDRFMLACGFETVWWME